jgi:hypothetical protein
MWRKIRNILKFSHIFYYQHGIFKFNLSFDKHVLKCYGTQQGLNDKHGTKVEGLN